MTPCVYCLLTRPYCGEHTGWEHLPDPLADCAEAYGAVWAAAWGAAQAKADAGELKTYAYLLTGGGLPRTGSAFVRDIEDHPERNW